MEAEGMAQLLDGKVALVTGASRGIGRAISLRLAEQGALVAVHYGSDMASAEQTVKAIEEIGGAAFPVAADLFRDGAIEQLIDVLHKELAARSASGLDILVNNAGIGMMATLSATDDVIYDRLFAINVRGMFFLTRSVLPLLRDGGRIVNLSSMVSVAAYPGCIAYAMTKASVNSFTRSLAAELGARGITVNAVAPGATATDFIGTLSENEGFMNAIRAQTALGRIGEPRDIAGVVSFLVSPAGQWITGQLIQASGGMHL
jgi:NAD(P)-dependent dehydrogenase (short-subunit alcohol dehydrogenase family)